MPKTFSITIQNASHTDQEFLLFQALPKPSNIAQSDVFSNVFQHSARISGDGTSRVTFEAESQWYAIYGTETGTGRGNMRISTMDSKQAKLGPNGSYQVLTSTGNGNSPRWGDSNGKTTDAAGAFTIATDNSFPFPNPSRIYFGVGAKNPDTGSVVPVQTFLAQPGTVSQLFPKPKFYVVAGSYEPGSIVDLNQLGRVLMVDFTSAAMGDATFTLNNRNEYQADSTTEQAGIKWGNETPRFG